MNLKIKETVAKIIGVFTGAEDITMASGEPGIRAERSDTGVKVGFIVGVGGTNHGVYSYKLNKWMVFSDGTYTWFDDSNGGHLRWDMGTNNTTDTWVPVLRDGKLQHRVIPTALQTEATKVGSYWTGGNIYVYRNEHTMWVKFNNITTTNTNRQNIARIPEGCRPPRETYSNSGVFGITYDGYIWTSSKLTGSYDVATYIQWD